MDACRIGANYSANELRPNAASHNKTEGRRVVRDGMQTAAEDVTQDLGYHNSAGRWPPNVALSHAEGCQRVGERRVKGATSYERNVTGFEQRIEYAQLTKGGKDERTTAAGYADPDGLETVEAWSCVEGCPVRELDRQSGELKAGVAGRNFGTPGYTGRGKWTEQGEWGGYGDAGGASRFFYVAKASRAERNAGLEGFEERKTRGNYGDGIQDARPHTPEGYVYEATTRNSHPTVKPVDLMRWLCRLVVPPGGVCLDPFAGSGTTGIACVLEDFDFIGIEREPDYVEIAKARIDYWAKQPKQLDLLGDAA